ncbi:uncharacterized protein LOC126894765 [Daktulosphaira vitifoliae]|uniref:uncharacterized protein LOC126894765 n=1 Tax=Daktulosphaira vitifoliae TaxID=58002 RepID=UPI0021AABA94|nr:uncharacterized protein LOC126894765 [Daktulosphaira vitifoliae]
MTKTTEEAGYELIQALLKFNDGAYGGRDRMVHKPAWKMLFLMLKYLNCYPELTSLPYQITPIILQLPPKYHELIKKNPLIVQRRVMDLLPIEYSYREFWKTHINRSRALPYQFLLWEGGFVLVVFCFYAVGDDVIRVVNITIHFSKKDVYPEPLCYQDKLMLEERYTWDSFNSSCSKPVSINTNRWTILRELKETNDKKGNEIFLLSLAPLMDELPDHMLTDTRRKILQILEEAISWKRGGRT